jgi:hypothetical protein
MTNHFCDIGIPGNTNESLMEMINRAIEEGITILTKKGHYIKWSSKSGAQLWMQFNKKNELIGVTPFFEGKSNFKVGITKKIIRRGDTDLEGAFYGWANPTNDKVDNGFYPFVFDLVNIGEYKKLKLPNIEYIKLVGFAHEVEVFPSEEAYNLLQLGKPGFASQSFIPSGLFSEGFKKNKKPLSEALITGKIIETKNCINELTQMGYIWILVETYGGEIDLVLDTNMITENININGIISGNFYLCGKMKIQE